MREIFDGKLEGPVTEHVLIRPSADRWKDRAQRLVTSHDFVQRAPQRLDIHGAVEVQRQGQVVEGLARRELIEKPEPLLCEREGGARGSHRVQSGTVYAIDVPGLGRARGAIGIMGLRRRSRQTRAEHRGSLGSHVTRLKV